jgi:hypothetical protein
MRDLHLEAGLWIQAMTMMKHFLHLRQVGCVVQCAQISQYEVFLAALMFTREIPLIFLIATMRNPLCHLGSNFLKPDQMAPQTQIKVSL